MFYWWNLYSPLGEQYSVKDQNEIQAMNKDLLKYKVQLVQLQYPVYTEMV
jgi:hypothetical protein